jgi:transcriptional regulator with XRE-family HTH domain
VTENSKKIGQRIKKLREVNNYTQDVLGKILNIPKQSISRIEKGKRTVSDEEIKIIADFFHVPVNAFYEDSWDDNAFAFCVKKPEHRWNLYPAFIDEFLKDIEDFFQFLTETNNADYDLIKNTINSTVKSLNELSIKFEKKLK